MGRANQASMVRRQRERERQLKRREKQALRAERREQKKAMAAERPEPEQVDDPMNDPSIDWGAAVRETEVKLDEDLQVIEEVEPSTASDRA